MPNQAQRLGIPPPAGVGHTDFAYPDRWLHGHPVHYKLPQNAEKMGLCADGTHAILDLEIRGEFAYNRKPWQKPIKQCTCKVYVKPGRASRYTVWEVCGKTEGLVVEGKMYFSEHIRLCYYAGRGDRVKFKLVNHGSGESSTTEEEEEEEEEAFANCETSLHEILSGNPFSCLDLSSCGTRKKNIGKLEVFVYQGYRCSKRVRLTVGASNLPRADIFPGKSDPYVVIGHNTGDRSFPKRVLAFSEVVPNQLSPSWNQLVFSVHCQNSSWNDNDDPEIVVEIFDRDTMTSDDYLACAQVRLSSFEKQMPIDMTLIYGTGRGRLWSIAPKPRLDVTRCSIMTFHSYVDYFVGGCSLRIAFAIEANIAFHGSNENTSLLRNALQKIGTGLSCFLSDQACAPIFIYNCQSGRSAPDPDIGDIWMSLGELRQSGAERIAMQCHLHRSTENGAAKLESVLDIAANKSIHPCKPSQENQHFDVMFILSTGRCSDESEVTRKICEISRTHPLQLVFIGIGGDEYSFLKRLDSDNGNLNTHDRMAAATRDIVDFVEYHDSMTPKDLSAYILKEVPESLTSYFGREGIRPNPTPAM